MASNTNEKNIQYFKNIIRMLKGEVEVNSMARRQFIEVAAGRRAPQTEWELIYTEWEAFGRPDIETWFNSGHAVTLLERNLADSNIKKKPKKTTFSCAS